MFLFTYFNIKDIFSDAYYKCKVLQRGNYMSLDLLTKAIERRMSEGRDAITKMQLKYKAVIEDPKVSVEQGLVLAIKKHEELLEYVETEDKVMHLKKSLRDAKKLKFIYDKKKTLSQKQLLAVGALLSSSLYYMDGYYD